MREWTIPESKKHHKRERTPDISKRYVPAEKILVWGRRPHWEGGDKAYK